MNIFKSFLCLIMILPILLCGVTLAQTYEEWKDMYGKIKNSNMKQPIKTEPKVFAKVNGKELLSSDLDFFVNRIINRVKDSREKVTDEMEQKFRKQWIDHIINKELLLQQAESEGIIVSDKEIENSFEMARQRGATISPDRLKRLIKDDLISENVIKKHVLSKVAVTDEDVKAYYNKRKDEFKQPEQVRARHILIKASLSDSAETKEAARLKIKSILIDASSANHDFAELARKHSEGPSGPKGGDLGYFAHGDMVPPFEKAAFSLKVGEVSDIVETQFGYHIIKVEERKEALVIPFAKLKEDIREDLKRERGKKGTAVWIAELRSKATIEIFR